ncbi:MAG: PilZ domain-containing protein [Bdellovibrionales bacterium]|nr:PilZ domain-containing protein [Bdellovibrionales bacterium]
MLKVLVVSRNETDNALIEKKLSPISKSVGMVQYYSARPANLNSKLDSQFNLLVYNCQHFNSAMRNNVSHSSSLGYLGPIMILVKIPNPDIIDSFADLQNVTIIEKPYENRDVQGIATKYLRDGKVWQRKHRRFDTKQKALLESYNRDYTSYTVISNISKGGAHIEGDLNDMSKGDLLRVCFELDELKKNHTMSAQVVWTSGDVGSNRTAGLKFISKSQVYETLLSGI